MMTWFSLPDRRELTLILFSLTVYLISYNIDTSLTLLGLNPSATEGAVLTRLGLGGTKYIDSDGRKPEGWRDALEEQAYGKWTWDTGHVAGDGSERSQTKGMGRHGAMWVSKRMPGATTSSFLGLSTVDQALLWWHDDLPVTKLVKHAPGTYTSTPPASYSKLNDSRRSKVIPLWTTSFYSTNRCTSSLMTGRHSRT